MSNPSWPEFDAFRIDETDAPALPFAARLARESGWTLGHANRVIREYKRFAFLAITAGHPVCPSEDVDQAWHLHLTYTRSYWKRFCGELLGRPLHHEPTKGGPIEADKHHDMYARTLAAYRTAFGHAPPADVWPSIEERFAPVSRFVRVNRDDSWVVPKRAVTRLAAGVGVASLAVVFAVGCVGPANPFALQGIQYLYFLIPVMIVAAILGRVLMSNLRSPGPQPTDDDVEFDWQQAAFLTGGAPRLATAALARLFTANAVEVSPTEDKLVPVGPEPVGLTPVESAVFRELPVEKSRMPLRKLANTAETTYSDEAAQLASDGHVVGQVAGYRIGCTALLPLVLVVLGFGIPRLFLGFLAGKPFLYLIVTLAVGGMIGFFVVLSGYARTTRRADAILKRMRATNAHIRSDSSTTSNAGLTVALFGTAALAGSPLSPLGTWFPHQTGSTGGCGSGCGAGGGGDGGCGSGCGGCGGD